FGAPMVDQNGVVQPFPARSLLTGLFANALGWEHREHARTQRLQGRVRFAARIDRAGAALVDYQTVDLGLPWMDPEQAGWTTRGRIAERGGDPKNRKGTHERYRHHRADSVHTVAVELDGDEQPSVDALAEALRTPARPLFIGRKACLPSTPLLLGVIDAPTALAALASAPRLPPRRGDDEPLLAWWDQAFGTETLGVLGPFEPVVVTDERDWKNQIHTGRRFLTHGRVDPPAPEARHA
ncbi:MAG: type I-E CRISPR-associated protein Cas5/CasD, partial [Deltaproteobacteria bacterium RBG_16_71_12]